VGEHRGVAASQLDEAGRLGRADGIPRPAGKRARLQRHWPPPRPERLQLVRRKRAEVPIRLDQVERRVAGERQSLQQLQLVVEVVLEPQHHARVRFQRVLEEPVTPLERLQQRLLRAPAAFAQEPGSYRSQLGRRQRGHRALVEDVLPREHRSAERGLPQRVARALAVRDVEQRHEPRIPPTAREEGGACQAGSTRTLSASRSFIAR
jgi:hypothetical protein